MTFLAHINYVSKNYQIQRYFVQIKPIFAKNALIDKNEWGD